MERIPIEGSSQIKSAGWSPNGPVMEIEFFRKSSPDSEGPVYSYDGVPESVWQNFLASPSRGRFFGQEIKKRYTCTKISG
jgi:hypothetical protein